MSGYVDVTALSPEERLRAAIKICLAGARRSAALKVYDTIQTQDYENEDIMYSANADQAQDDAA